MGSPCASAINGVCKNCTRDDHGCQKGLSGLMRQLYGNAAQDRVVFAQEILRSNVAREAAEKAAANKVTRMLHEYSREMDKLNRR